MPDNRRERKKEQTRSKIIAVAIQLFRKEGFSETAIDDILAQADVSRGTLYNYFPDKDSILAGYFQQKIAAAGETFRTKVLRLKGIRTQLKALLDLMHRLLAEDAELAKVYLRYRLKDIGTTSDSSQRKGIENLVAEVVQAAQAAHEIRTDLPPAISARNFQLLFMGFLVAGVQAGAADAAQDRLDREQMIELFLHGAGARQQEA